MIDIELNNYDMFIGRCIEDRSKYFVALDPNGKHIILKSFGAILECLCSHVKLDKKILLSKEPGTIKTEIFYRKIKKFKPFTQKQMSKLEREYELRLDLKLKRNPFLYQPDQEGLNIKMSIYLR
ncbi:MAG: hypothetical protein AABW90_01110 [Nanoarchaeota archaeon]